jgi:RecA/RadA recombinase
MEAMDDWPQQGQTARAASTLGGGPHTLSEALRAILYPNESAHTLFKRARTKPFRTGLEIFDLAEQFMYGGAAPPPPADNSNESSERDLHSHSGREEISASAGGEATSTSNRGGIRGGDVVEFYGKTGSGKTEMLLHIVASTILPSTWSPSSTSTTTSSSSSGGSQRLELEGEGAGAIFFDNDLKFDILRLERVLRARIRLAVAKLRQQRAASRQKKTTRSHRGAAASRKRQRVANNDDEAEEEADEEVEWPSAEDEDELVRTCLARLTVFRCEDSLQFLATLQMADELIRNYARTQQQPRQPATATSTTSTAKGKEKETRQSGAAAAAAAEVKVIVIDSIGAFHNADRYAEPYGGGFGGKGGYYGGSKSRMNKVVLALKQLVNAHNLIVFAGKGAHHSNSLVP